MPGTLYVVATPIGNLEDITFRAVRTLKEVDRIVCEDTRQTRKLLQHYGIEKPMVSCHEFNEAERAAELVGLLAEGESLALVSDAGTPLISDPGFRLIRAAVEARIPVVPIPGPSAVLAALAASGLPTDAFLFAGFLPAKSGQRRNELERLRSQEATLVFYETPHRILESLGDIAVVLGNRQVVAGRELTKIHEEFLRGTAAEIRHQLAARDSIRGEFTLLVGRALPDKTTAVDETTLRNEVQALEQQGTARMEAIKQVARHHGLGKRDVYRLIELKL